ncbi:TetR/AcrR family transcriptional regulator [Paenibacillus albiflavus]|uniref:TetR/AcrR family transcriptional regulator n=1 Tax=Paenibacillus albiflavus TaxID=2545760 RepID=A0A4R4E8B5_9BACL|nr:TetR/AcrR family transcriptional regulator [Paenibacillus albiflavus]TCZ75789.1 TetR/AcrR family transcriptional regulator [Paenibacillus albiflavus]
MNREDKKRLTRQNVLNAAIELFAEQSYEATTITQITERAGIAKGTFFNYFANKEDLICDIQVIWAVEEVRRIKEQPGLLIPHIRYLIMQIDKFHASRQLMLAVNQGIISSPKAIRNQLEQIDELVKALTEVIEEGQRRGEFTSSLPAAMICEIAIQTYLGTRLYWSMGRGDSNLGTQMVVTFELFFKSIMA